MVLGTITPRTTNRLVKYNTRQPSGCRKRPIARTLAPADRVERGGDAGTADGQTDRAAAGRMLRERKPPGSNDGRRW